MPSKANKKPPSVEQMTRDLLLELRERIDLVSVTLVEIERAACILERHVERDRTMRSKRRARVRCDCG